MSRAGARRSPARLDPRAVPGAKPAPFPRFVEPCHPTLRQKAPSGGDSVHEIKFDGYRTQAHLRNGEPAIYTRRGYAWTRRFRTIADGAARSEIDHDRARACAKRIAQRLAVTAPERYTLAAAPEKRAGRIFIDYLRNDRGKRQSAPGRRERGRDFRLRFR
jgi:hypothetical protein